MAKLVFHTDASFTHLSKRARKKREEELGIERIEGERERGREFLVIR